MPSSPLRFRKKLFCCFDLNLIPNTFLEAAFAMSVPPYLIDLANPGEDKVTLL